MRAPVWIVAGPPGAGKTTIAGLLARTLDPPAAVLDKDTMFGDFVAASLAAAGRPFGEREGPWYDIHIKPHEYAGLAATARHVRESGCPVILVAPFTQQQRDPQRWQELTDACGGEPVRMLWVRCSPDTLRNRLIGRGSGRDGQKLSTFDAFLAAVQPDRPPAVPHVVIDNNANGIADVLEQLQLSASREPQVDRSNEQRQF